MVGPLVRQPDFLTLGVAAAASRLISARPSSYRGSATFRCTATGSACRRTRPHPLQEVTWRLRGKAHSPGLPRHGGSTESVGSGGNTCGGERRGLLRQLVGVLHLLEGHFPSAEDRLTFSQRSVQEGFRLQRHQRTSQRGGRNPARVTPTSRRTAASDGRLLAAPRA
jgi:hypothetical protein